MYFICEKKKEWEEGREGTETFPNLGQVPFWKNLGMIGFCKNSKIWQKNDQKYSNFVIWNRMGRDDDWYFFETG